MRANGLNTSNFSPPSALKPKGTIIFPSIPVLGGGGGMVGGNNQRLGVPQSNHLQVPHIPIIGSQPHPDSEITGSGNRTSNSTPHTALSNGSGSSEGIPSDRDLLTDSPDIELNTVSSRDGYRTSGRDENCQ